MTLSKDLWGAARVPSYEELREFAIWLNGALDVLPEDHATQTIKEKLSPLIARWVADKFKDEEPQPETPDFSRASKIGQVQLEAFKSKVANYRAQAEQYKVQGQLGFRDSLKRRRIDV